MTVDRYGADCNGLSHTDDLLGVLGVLRRASQRGRSRYDLDRVSPLHRRVLRVLWSAQRKPNYAYRRTFHIYTYFIVVLYTIFFLAKCFMHLK